ncbi:MAG: efflux RND transporter permease subunit [Clostridia bacterium]|nr:efflux RND transporter permease subunit [Clostridia bacterium]
MKLTEFSIKRPVTMVMIICIILVLGFISLVNLKIDLFPEMNLPVALVIVQYSGTGPEEMETLVTRPLEEALSTVHNIKSVISFSQQGSSVVVLQFNWGTDMDFTMLEIREKVDLVEGMLPAGCEDPLIFKMDPSMMPVYTIAMSGDVGQEQLRQLAEDEVKNRLERIEGVASVSIYGGLEREIKVKIRPEVLQAHGLTLSQIIQTLGSENFDITGGRAYQGEKEYLVRVLGQFAGVEEIGDVRIFTQSGGSIRLGDIAEIEDGHKDVNSYSLINDKPSVALFVSKQSDANIVEVARGIREALKELEGRLPAGVELLTVVDQAEFIEKSIYNVLENLIVGSILAILILFLFLRSVQSTLIISLSIPISLITTFVLVYFRGLTLNMMTLGGLALGVGMMVDNSIVILENIFRHRQQGELPLEAALKGSNEMALAITASTLTTIAVFFPIVFVEGLASQIFAPLALTVSFSLLASLAVALTLIPMLSSRVFPMAAANYDHDAHSQSRLKRIFYVWGTWLEALNEKYLLLLKWAITHGKTVVLITVAALVISIALIPLIGVEFIPQMDEGLLSIDIEMPQGTRLEHTEEVVEEVKGVIEKQPEVETVFVTVGSQMGQSTAFMSGEGQSEYAHIDVQLVDKGKRKRSTNDVVEALRKEIQNIPGAEFEVSASNSLMYGGGSSFSTPISVEIKGQEIETLEKIAQDVSEIVASVPGTREVQVSMEDSKPQVQVVVDRSKASFYGLSVSQITNAVRGSIEGQIATRYRTGSDEIDVRVLLETTKDLSLQELEVLELMTPTGVQVPLREVADIKIAKGPNVIERQDQTRTVSVTSKLHDRDLGRVMEDIQSKLDNYALPSGYTIDYGGESKEMAEAFGDLSYALILAIVLVYMILAGQFESFIYPFVIMFSIPVSIVGVVLGLLLTGRTFNIPAFIGVIMLAGIVVNNAIVFVDYINQLRRKGLDRDEAILMAGPHRLRPILMTTLTTVLGMLPLAFGFGEGAEVRAPMATVLIGGLTTSTLLTLVFVPVMYVLLEDMLSKMKKKLGLLFKKEKSGQIQA